MYWRLLNVHRTISRWWYWHIGWPATVGGRDWWQ